MMSIATPSILPRFRAGDRVRVKRWAAIRDSLDADGCLDAMPFMPEMLAYCGRTMRVRSVAHKTCDTIRNSGGRALDRALHLEDARCDGSAHDGCQAGCSLFWKEDWLEPADVSTPASVRSDEAIDTAVLRGFARVAGTDPAQWRCQTTQLLQATRPLAWWDARQYVADVSTGNHRPRHLLALAAFAGFRKLVALGWGYRLLIGCYDAVQAWRGRPGFPDRPGKIARGTPTPTELLELRPGERVRVKSHAEILATLNVEGVNRGMRFDPEMAKYCGGTYHVAARITQILDEKTGRMIPMKNPCILLEDVYCRAQCTSARLGCPRAVNTYWLLTLAEI